MLTLQRADLVVLQGADFEPWGDAVSETLLTEGVPVVFATHGLDLHEGGHAHDEEHEDEDEHEYEEDTSTEQTEDEVGHDDEHEYESHDPHTWLDPVLFSQSVDTLVEALIVIDPTNAAMYETNAEALQADLRVLNTQYAATLSNCNLSEIITSHDAFGYVGDRYGFTIHTIAGISTQDAPSATTLATLRAEAAEGIGAILLEANSVTAYGETLARETGLQTLSINPIAFIIPENETYLSIMNTNLDTFATALNCNE
jgi:zinc transport system substrate-binding protein